MSIYEKLKNLNLNPETTVTLSYSEGVDVFVHNETEVETALAETDVVNTFAELITTPGLDVNTQWGNESVMQTLRSEGLLEDYERDGDFASYVTDVLTENFYDQDFVEYSTERYDHKRGFTTLSAEVQVPITDILQANPHLSGWEVSVQTENGVLTL